MQKTVKNPPMIGEESRFLGSGRGGGFIGRFAGLFDVARTAALGAFLAVAGGVNTAFVGAGFAGVGGFLAAIGLSSESGAGQSEHECEKRDFGDEFHDVTYLMLRLSRSVQCEATRRI